MLSFKQFIAEQVINNPATQTTTAYKTPGSDAARTGYKSIYGASKATPATEVKPVTPLPKSDTSQSAMPDMDTMVSREKSVATKPSSSVIPRSTGIERTNVPVGSNQVKPSRGLAPAESQKASSGKSYKIKKGDNPTTIAKNLGISLKDLASKNPGLIRRAKRLKIGGSINI